MTHESDPFSFDYYLEREVIDSGLDESHSEYADQVPTEPYLLDVNQHPMKYFFGKNPVTGEFLVSDEALATRQPVWVVPHTDENQPANRYSYKELKPKVKNLDRMRWATDLFQLVHEVREPHKNTQVSISKLETIIPQVYALLGYNTGEAAAKREACPEVQEQIDRGILVHKMRLVMHLAARSTLPTDYRAMVPTMTGLELQALDDVISRIAHESLQARIMKSWNLYAHNLIDLGVLTPGQAQLTESDAIKYWHLLLADYYTQEYQQRSPQPEFNTQYPTIFEPALRFFFQPAHMYVRMQPDQIVITPNSPLLIEFKTSHILKSFKERVKRDNDPVDRQTVKTRRDVALRQNQLMLLAAVQLTRKIHEDSIDLTGNQFRGETIPLVKQTLSVPQALPSLVYEMFSYRQHKGYEVVRSSYFNYYPEQWQTFYTWIEQFSRALRMTTLAQRKAISQGVYNLPLTFNREEISQVDPNLILAIRNRQLPD